MESKRQLSEIVKSNMRKSNCHFNRMKLVLPYVYQVSPSISTGKMGKLQLTFTDVLMPVVTIQCKPISGCMVTFPIWHQELWKKKQFSIIFPRNSRILSFCWKRLVQVYPADLKIFLNNFQATTGLSNEWKCGVILNTIPLSTTNLDLKKEKKLGPRLIHPTMLIDLVTIFQDQMEENGNIYFILLSVVPFTYASIGTAHPTLLLHWWVGGLVRLVW